MYPYLVTVLLHCYHYCFYLSPNLSNMTGVEPKNLLQLGLYQTSDLFESSSRVCFNFFFISMHACLSCFLPLPYLFVLKIQSLK
jgi:hypothetical protein